MVETLPSRFPEESELMCQSVAVISRFPSIPEINNYLSHSTYLRQLIDRNPTFISPQPAEATTLRSIVSYYYMQHFFLSACSTIFFLRGFRKGVYYIVVVLLYDYIIKDCYFTRRIATDISYQKNKRRIATVRVLTQQADAPLQKDLLPKTG
jgi:hypothetical protein